MLQIFCRLPRNPADLVTRHNPPAAILATPDNPPAKTPNIPGIILY